MGFWALLEVATMPILQVILVTVLGAFMASGHWNILNADARKYLNKIVFMVFTPSLMFSSLAQTVTLQDIISWWFMPINTGLTFLFGGILGWVLVKVLKPVPHLRGLIIATCSAGNLGNLLLIVLPAICNEERSPFGERSVCRTLALSYASFSMALGGFFIWTYTYHLVRSSSIRFEQRQVIEAASKAPNDDLDDKPTIRLLKDKEADLENDVIAVVAPNATKDTRDIIVNDGDTEESDHNKVMAFLHTILEELMSPPTLGAIGGFIFGTIWWLRNLIIGPQAPLRVIQDSVKLLGDGTIPCITLILGGNLTQGLRTSTIKPKVVVGIILVRYLISPAIGILVVRAARELGFLSPDPLYQYALMMQYTVPPAMNIGTMTELFDVGKEECSVLMMWTYLVAAVALTVWSTVFMWLLA